MNRRALWRRVGERLAAQHRGEVLGPDSATDLDLAMMQRALELAHDAASVGEVPVGAVVYDLISGRIVAEGANRRETDRLPHAHAEHIAMVEAARQIDDWRLSNLGLAVTLEPCPMCAGLIVNARVDRLVYGAPDPKAGAAGSLMHLTTDPRLNHRVTPIAGVLREESSELLKHFFKRVRARRRDDRSRPPSKGKGSF